MVKLRRCIGTPCAVHHACMLHDLSPLHRVSNMDVRHCKCCSVPVSCFTARGKPSSFLFPAYALHSGCRSLANGMVVGTSEGFVKDLQLIGVGYRGAVNGNTLTMNLGFSHPVVMTIPHDVEVKVPVTSNIQKNLAHTAAAVKQLHILVMLCNVYWFLSVIIGKSRYQKHRLLLAPKPLFAYEAAASFQLMFQATWITRPMPDLCI